jgi:hypothetical protein
MSPATPPIWVLRERGKICALGVKENVLYHEKLKIMSNWPEREKNEIAHPMNYEFKVLQGLVLRFSNFQETSDGIDDSTSCFLVIVECTGGNQNESSASIDDTSSKTLNSLAIIFDTLVNAPVRTSRSRLGNGSVSNFANESVRIRSTKGE